MARPSQLHKVLAELQVPEVYRTPVKGSYGSAIAKLNALGIDAICHMITNGQTLQEIAREADVALASLLTWLERDPNNSARAKEARRITAWHWDEQAVTEIRNASSEPAEIARAREIAFHYRWRAGKLNQAVYGEKSEQKISGEIVHTTPDQRRQKIEQLEKRLGRVPPTIDGKVEE